MPKAQHKPPEVTTVDQLFAWDGDGTDRKFELVDGVLRAMAPAAPIHSVLQANITALLVNHVRARRLACIVGTEPGVIPRVQSAKNFRIADVGVFCGKNADGDRVLTDPILLVEVLSPGNKAKTWTNIWTYTTLPTVQELLVVSSAKIEAKLIRRQPDGNWPDTPLSIDDASTLELTSIDLKLPLTDLYAGTRLAR